MPSLLTSGNITGIQLKESSAPATPSSGYGRLYVDLSGGLHFIDDAGNDIALTADAVLREIAPGGRLTLTSGAPVTTADVTGAGTLYYAPYRHNVVYLYDGSSAWVRHTFTERSLSLTLTSGKNYDVFIYNNSGALALELSAAWTNDTTRADALTTQDGITVKSGATTRLWLGTIRASGSNTTEDSVAKGFVWNAYNQVHRLLKGYESTDSWTTSSSTWASLNASTANRLEYVCGLAGSAFRLLAGVLTANAVNQGVAVGVGVDSTSTNSASRFGGVISTGAGAIQMSAEYAGTLLLGYHYLQILERNEGAGVTTFYGDAGAPTLYQSGWTMEMFS